MSTMSIPRTGSRHTPSADSSAPSMVERITSIMDAFTLPLARLSLEEVTRRSGLPRSTTHRILDQLVQSGWTSHIGNLYSLGPRALRLGAREIVYNELRSASNARLHQLAQSTGLVVHLAALDGPEIYYVDKFGANARQVPSVVGGRAPAHCTAAGKGILAWLPPEVVHEQYSGEDQLDAKTRRSIPSVAALHQELARIRGRNGVAFEQGECFPSISCIGIAIRDLHGPVAAISVVGQNGAPLDRLAPLLVSTARTISAHIVQAEKLSTATPAE